MGGGGCGAEEAAEAEATDRAISMVSWSLTEVEFQPLSGSRSGGSRSQPPRVTPPGSLAPQSES
jgi:hypothetical protein